MPKELGTEQPGARWAGVLILVGLLLLTFLLAPRDSLISFVSDEGFTNLIQDESAQQSMSSMPGESLAAASENGALACQCQPVCHCCDDADQPIGHSPFER